MFFCLLFPKKRALFENKTPISRQKCAQDLNYKEGSAGSKSRPAVFMPPTPPKASFPVVLLTSQSIPNGPPRTPAPTRQTIARKRGRLIAAPTAMSDRLQRPWVQTVTKYAPGRKIVCPQADLFSPGQIHGAGLPLSRRGDPCGRPFLTCISQFLERKTDARARLGASMKMMRKRTSLHYLLAFQKESRLIL